MMMKNLMKKIVTVKKMIVILMNQMMVKIFRRKKSRLKLRIQKKMLMKYQKEMNNQKIILV